MNIAELTAFHVRIPLRRAIRHASHRRTSTDNLIVRCVLVDGTTGYGEGVPRDYVTGDTIASDLDLLRAADWSPWSSDCPNFAEAVRRAEAFRLPRVGDDSRECLGNAAQCAVELAILDGFGRHFGQPLSSIPALLTPELAEPSDRVQYSGAITSTQGFKLRLVSRAYRAFGFKQLKVKVGIPGQDDPGRLRIIRRCAGRKMDLRIDANEAWSATNAKARIEELIPFGVTSVEQPIPHEQSVDLAMLRREVAVPIMLDESLCSMVDARRAVEQGWCDLFNLRLSKCGGFIASLRLAQYARRQGIGYQLGCQVGETAILSAAGRHFATSVGGIRYLEGSYDRHLVREALGRQDVTFRWGGWAPALRGPGLGIEIDPTALERVTISKEVLLG